MKVAVLSNNRIVLPVLQSLAQQGIFCPIATDAANMEMISMLTPYCDSGKMQLRQFVKNGFATDIKEWLHSVNPDVVMMFTWPYVIPEDVLSIPKYGFVNFHFGKLPEYRGANPVFEHLRKREKAGAVTVHKVDKHIDTGDILLQQTVPIEPEETFASLMRKLSWASVGLVRSIIDKIRQGEGLNGFAQDNTTAQYYKKPGQRDVTINWEMMDAEDIIALCNACNPWNFGAATSINGWKIGVLETIIKENATSAQAGSVLTVDRENGLQVACRNNKVLQLTMIYTEDGFMQGWRLSKYGVVPGMLLGT